MSKNKKKQNWSVLLFIISIIGILCAWFLFKNTKSRKGIGINKHNTRSYNQKDNYNPMI